LKFLNALLLKTAVVVLTYHYLGLGILILTGGILGKFRAGGYRELIVRDVLHLLMLNKDVRGEALKNPLVPETLLRGEPLGGVPLEALRDETHKGVVRDVSQLHHDILQPLLLLLRREHLKLLLPCIFF